MKKWFSRNWFWLVLIASSYQFGSSLVGHKHGSTYIWSDAEGYYMYLPAVFMYGGDFEKMPVRTKVQFKAYPGTKKIFTKYTYGVALLEAPFFLASYSSRFIQGFNPRSYAANDYSVGILLAACVYGVLGLFFLWKTLLRHFTDRWAIGLSLATLLMGTNLVHYIARTPGMSHVYSFFLASLLVWLTPGLYRSASWSRFAGAGLVAGLIVLIRPSNGLLLLWPLLYGVASWEDLRQRLSFFVKNSPKILLAAAIAAAVWVPQFCYWHYLSGHWFLDSYSKESFQFWDRPQVGSVLFSVLNGYFIYNPVMLVPVVAMFFMLKKNHLNAWASLLIFVGSTYVFGSWWCWWFGGSYGHRCYVDLLPVLVFPLCWVLAKILSTPMKWVKIASLALLVLLVFYNFRLVILYEWFWSREDWDWPQYWEVFRQVFFM